MKRNSISLRIVDLRNLFNDILPNTVTGLFLKCWIVLCLLLINKAIPMTSHSAYSQNQFLVWRVRQPEKKSQENTMM